MCGQEETWTLLSIFYYLCDINSELLIPCIHLFQLIATFNGSEIRQISKYQILLGSFRKTILLNAIVCFQNTITEAFYHVYIQPRNMYCLNFIKQNTSNCIFHPILPWINLNFLFLYAIIHPVISNHFKSCSANEMLTDFF